LFMYRKPGISTLIILLLVLLTVLTFNRVIGHQFTHYDDNQYVTENQHVLQGINLRSITWAFTATYAANWHPLTWISHMLDCQLYGTAPWGHHLTNLLLHLANTILLFLLLQYMTGSIWRSAFVAALFGIHPLHVESVAWVAERKDLLSTLFFMLTLFSYVRYTKRPGIKYYLPVLLLYALGLMAKPMLVTLPLILLLLDFWPLDRIAAKRDCRKCIVEKIPLLLLALGSCIITFIAQRKGGAVLPLEQYSIGVRLANSTVAYLSYILKTILPVKLAVFYPHPGEHLPFWLVLASALSLLGLTALAALRTRRAPYLTVGWFWYLISLLPVIGLVQVGGQAMADRYTYIPLIGLFIALAWYVNARLAEFKTTRLPFTARHLFASIAGFILLTLAICARIQTNYWQNDEALFRRAIAVTQNNYIAYNNLGNALLQKNRTDEAIKCYKKATEISPGFKLAYINLGNLLIIKKSYDEAFEALQRAVMIDPTDAAAHCKLGTLFYETDNSAAAEREYRLAMKLDPGYAPAYQGLGDIMADRSMLQAALENYHAAYRLKPEHALRERIDKLTQQREAGAMSVDECLTAIRKTPGNIELYNHLGNALFRAGRFAEAYKAYERVVSAYPHQAPPHNNLGLALFRQSKISEARRCFAKAIEIKPDYGEAHTNLSVMLYYLKDYENAWKEMELGIRYGSQPKPAFLQALTSARQKKDH
jgi:tetratricopeptide (TPR) repeat protein